MKKKILFSIAGFLAPVVVALLMMLSVLLIFVDEPKQDVLDSTTEVSTTQNISPEVLRYKDLFIQYATKYGIREHVNVIMALVMQESGGRYLDVMQSSESIGLPPNSITDPEQSIDVGMKHFKSVLMKAKGDIDLTLQAYNFGGGFIDYVNSGRGGKYTLALAHEFSSYQANKLGWASYGDPLYVPHVRRYISTNAGATNFEGNFKMIMDEALTYQGNPYVWGGSNPNTGFDCSGLTSWTYRKAGISLPRTAQEQYYASKRIDVGQAKAGDLVFFTGTYEGKYITHVGIYLGNGQMYNSNSSGIKYDTLTGYWASHLVGYGRVANF
ncbi:lysozyme family protein [Listeria booriae]|uniref:bifunctional lytic transglycosylase/C40 family peptidase n=1 Tax=Listeria booriae TaxID=1552123 RepID=UPI0028806068|nr:lysozyme family protein [Listeria booriae]MDT0109332.1 lysozyme family protein [Listeria booriae]